MTRPTVQALAIALGAALSPSVQTQTPQRQVFRTRVDSVSVPVSVQRGNSPVVGLKLSDFIVKDNGVLQTVDSFSTETVPIDVTLFLDNSGSTSGLLADLKRDLVKIAGMLRPDDRFRLLTFGTEVSDVFGWQQAETPLPVDTIPVGRTSSVYDALFLAMMHRPTLDRRHLIVALTDGEDFGSITSSVIVRETASRAEGVLHMVLVQSDPRPTGAAPVWTSIGPDRDGLARLTEAATRTGGALHPAPIRRSQVVDAFKKVFDEFRHSYMLRYSPVGVVGDGWHAIDVAVVNGARYRIRARTGYFSARLKTLPVGPTGKESRNSTTRGYLNAANCSLPQATSSSAVSAAPGFNTMNALTSSPSRSSGMPTTAASDTAGCVISTSSISRG